MSYLLQELSRRYPHVRARQAHERRDTVLRQVPFKRVFAPEIAFLAAYGVADATLLAAATAARCGVSSEQALLGEGLMGEEDYYRALARHLRAPYYCGELTIAPDVIPAKAVASGLLPLAPNELGLRVVVAPRGAAIELLLSAAREGRLPASFVICSPQRMAAILRARMGGAIAAEASSTLASIDASLCARTGVSGGQMACACGALTLSVVLWLTAPQALTLLTSVVLWVIFAAAVVLRLVAMAASRAPRSAPPLADTRLPIYSIIVPLYQEAAGIPRLVAALDALDYPGITAQTPQDNSRVRSIFLALWPKFAPSQRSAPNARKSSHQSLDMRSGSLRLAPIYRTSTPASRYSRRAASRAA